MYYINFTESDFCYPYRELPIEASDAQVQSYCTAIKRIFKPIAHSFDEEANSIWVLRHYLALKLLIASNILAGSALYSRDHNLTIGIGYYNYYSILSCCRAFLLTSPDMVWQGRNTVEMTHKKILNITADLMKRLDVSRGAHWRSQLEIYRNYRELYSYRFPGSGVGLAAGAHLDPERASHFARLIAELAMLNSECFEACLTAAGVPGSMRIPETPDHQWAVSYEIAGAHTADSYDKMHFGKFLRKWGRVSTLEVMAYDGMIEDVYGAWTIGDLKAGQFNPDDYMDLIMLL